MTQNLKRRTTAFRAIAVSASALALLAALGQADAAPAAPSLEGLWTNVSSTPFERPAAFDGPTTTPEAAAAYEKSSLAAFSDAAIDEIGGRQSEWFELGGPMLRIGGKIRTSVVVQPTDGQLPYSSIGRARLAAGYKARLSGFDNPESRTANERCLAGGSGSSGVPMLPHWDTSLYKIVQTKGDLAIWIESGGPRIIHMNETRHLPGNMRPWMGDSIGHWKGRTLVVETTNFNPGETTKTPQQIYISTEAKVTERFTRISPQAILYAFTVDDPQAFTRPWRGELLLRAAKGPIFEFACHEGNYSLPGILAGARREERLAAGAEK